MRGRKPVPTALKLLRGNPGKRPLNAQEPQPLAETPPCPAHLDAEAKAEWKRMSGRLTRLGLLTEIDGAALAAYCGAWSRWVAAEAEVKKHGLVVKTALGLPIQNPFLGVSNKAVEQMRRFLIEFGMTPVSRTRIKVSGRGKESEFEKFMAGRKAL